MTHFTFGNCIISIRFKMSGLFGNLMPRANQSTFRDKKRLSQPSQDELLKHASATLGSGNLRDAVRLPKGEDRNEWIAVNIVDFFKQVSMLYGTISEYCTRESCAKMNAGPKYEYYWQDSRTKKPIPCPAPLYVDYMMTWVQDQLDDEAVFPSQIGKPFPANFPSVVNTIMKRLFRVYAHIYHEHFETIELLKSVEHLNTSFKHFMLFVQEFDMIEPKELAPMQEYIDRLAPKR